VLLQIRFIVQVNPCMLQENSLQYAEQLSRTQNSNCQFFRKSDEYICGFQENAPWAMQYCSRKIAY